MSMNFCPVCGEKIQFIIKKNRKRNYCPKCNRLHYKNPTVGVAVIVLNGKSILLVKRKGSYSGKWCIPCGHVEWGEDIREAGIRELKEETGLDVEITTVYDVLSNFHDPECLTVGVWFLSKVMGGELEAGSDAVEAEFFPLAHPPENLAFPTDIRIIQQLAEDVKA